ncbi:MAG: hypothetical protein UU63_C0064G0005 [Candidatus Uhrbacteria bacterium GW2011_GWF2_41_430]|nr:MAG: hypothetical protein UU63_C0064G0005 [Candidatus Uhrbacteria bacterium GW2011_GWF2_41_430]
MGRIRVINKLTGKTGTVSEEFYDPNKYTLTGSEQSTPQGGGSAVGNFLGGLAKPFVNTGERVAGAGESLLRMFLANAADKAAKEGDTERALKLGELGSRESALTRGEKPELTDPLQIAKDSAAILSWGVPVGGKTSILGKGLKTTVGGGGALAGATGGFGYSEETTPEGILGNVATGAATGFASAKILNKLFPGKGAKAAKTAEEAAQEVAQNPNAAEKFGLSMKRGVFRPEAGSGPQSILKENEAMMWAHNKGIDKGSAEAMRYGVADIYNKDYIVAANAIKNSTAPALPVDDVVNTIKSLVTENGDFFVPGDKTQMAVLNKELALIRKLATNGQIDDKGIFEAVNNINQQLGKVSSKVGGRSDAAVQAVEGIRWDVSTVLHDMLREANPQAADVLLDMSMAHRVAKGLYKAGLENVNLFGMPIPGIAPTIQAAQNAVGDAALAVGGAGKGATAATKATTPLLNTKVGKEIPAALSAFVTQKPKTQEVPAVEPEAGVASEGLDALGISKETLGLIALLPPKTQASLMEKIITEKILNGGGDKNLTEAQVARKNAASSINRALNLVQKGSVNTGMIGGPIENLKAKIGAADPETLEFNTLISSIKASIAKARAGTSFTPNEEKMLDRYTPNVGDSYQEIVTKLRGLQTVGL